MKKILSRGYKGIKTIFGGYGLEKFYPIRIIHNFILRHLKSDFAVVQGHKMFLDSNDSLNLSVYGIHEEFETELVKKEIKPGDVVLDIGANIGYYTLIFAKLVGENGRVFAFEPDPTNFALLKRNVEINGYKNVVLIQKAVSNKSGKLRLYLSENNKGDHRIYNSHDGRKFIDIESVKLDDYFNHNVKIDFIKMDIQGAEGGAIQGMSKLLEKNVSVKIISEFWPAGLKRFGIEPIAYLKLLLRHGFKLYELNEKKKKLDLVDIAKLLETYTIEKDNHTNLLCIRMGF